MEPVFPFDLHLPRAGEGQITRELHRQLRAAIVDGRLPAGAALPASRRAAQALGVGRNTVVGAYDQLIAEGYVLPRPGARARVADVAARRGRVSARHADRVDDPRIQPFWREPLPRAAQGAPPRGFRLGVPEHARFPHEAWRRLSARALRDFARRPFTYGAPEGLPELREAIVRHVAFARAVACTADDVVVTSGAQQAFDLLARVLVQPGRTKVAVEDPGYPPLRAVFRAAGAQLVPVPVDDEGIVVERIPIDARVIYVTPSHQYPLGMPLSLARRRALLDFARARGAVIIEDDYDGEFRYTARPLDALQTLDRDGCVCYVGTFSKSLFPSLRQGFVVAPSWARAALLTAKNCADSHGEAITQATLAAFIAQGHLASHVRRMQAIYARRREVLVAAIDQQLSPWLTVIDNIAGLSLAARWRRTRGIAPWTRLAQTHLPGVATSASMSLGEDREPALILGYGAIDAEAMAAPIANLRAALRA